MIFRVGIARDFHELVTELSLPFKVGGPIDLQAIQTLAISLRTDLLVDKTLDYVAIVYFDSDKRVDLCTGGNVQGLTDHINQLIQTRSHDLEFGYTLCDWTSAPLSSP